MRKQMEKMIQADHRFANKLWATPKGLVFSDSYILIEWSGEKGTEVFPADYELIFTRHKAARDPVPFGRVFIEEVEDAQRLSVEDRRKRVDAAKQKVAAAKQTSVAAVPEAKRGLAEAEDELTEARQHVTPFICQGAYVNPQPLLKILKILKTGTIQADESPLYPLVIRDTNNSFRALIMPRR